MNPRISFIVPVRNDAARLATCLRSIQRNGHAVSHIEIVVVDNASTDGSADVARRFGARVVAANTGAAAELRNRGAQESTGDILAFVDADNEIGAGWSYTALECLRLPAVGAAGALYRAPIDGTWVQRTYGYLRGRAQGRHDVDWLSSGNLAVWRRTFDEVGRFDTSLEACEDVDLCSRIRGRGLRVVSDARLESIHHGDPRTLKDLFLGERWRGRDNVRVSFRSPISWTALPSAIVPVVDAAMLGVGLVGAVAMIGSVRAGLLVTGSALALMLTGSCLKVMRAVIREENVRGVAVLQAFVVACVYDIARALALVTRAPHRSAARGSAVATT